MIMRFDSWRVVGEADRHVSFQLGVGGPLLRRRGAGRSEERGRHLLRLHPRVLHGRVLLREDNARQYGRGVCYAALSTSLSSINSFSIFCLHPSLFFMSSSSYVWWVGGRVAPALRSSAGGRTLSRTRATRATFSTLGSSTLPKGRRRSSTRFCYSHALIESV